MKLVVLAHTPPPFHGQSYMVRILLDCFPSVERPPAVECIHVDFRLSTSVDDIGQRPWSKLRLLFRYCFQAIRARFRHGVTTLLYVPAPALRHAIYRDWIVMLCCRPFFQKRVYWWHAAGLGIWLRDHANPVERWLTNALVTRPDLSLVLGTETEIDARLLRSRQIALLPNAIPDPCPDLAPELVRQKATRRVAGRAALNPSALQQSTDSAPNANSALFRLLFIGLCYSQKGLFDTVEAVARANERLAHRGSRARVHLDVAGRFFLQDEQRQFEERIRRPDLLLSKRASNTPIPTGPANVAVAYHGFVSGAEKDRLFRDTDCLVFPTYYPAESFGLVILEAMAYGLDVIASRWHSIPELLPPNHPGLVEPHDPADLDAAIDLHLEQYHGERLRKHYEENFALARFQERFQGALLKLDPIAGRA